MTSHRSTRSLGNAEPAHTWGRNIRAQRDLLGLTQQELADAVGVTAATVCRWEKGYDAPALHRLPTIAATLRVPTSVMFPLPQANAA